MTELRTGAHALLIASQLALFLCGTLTFIFGASVNFEDHFPSFDEWEHDVQQKHLVPFVASGVGAFGTFVNIILVTILMQDGGDGEDSDLYMPIKSPEMLRSAIFTGCGTLSFFAIGDIILSIKAGLVEQLWICGLAAVAGFFTVFAVSVNLYELWRPHPSKEGYAMVFSRNDSEPLLPSYQAAVEQGR